MKLFYFKPNQFKPILIIVAKLDNEELMGKLEAYTHEIFQILMDEKEADETNIIVFSVIKDHDKSTINLILPSIKSNINLVTKLENDTQLVNKIIVQTLMKSNTELYFELKEDRILIHSDKLNLGDLTKFYLF
jgi:subtilase family serine protease